MHRTKIAVALLGVVLTAARAETGTIVSYPRGSETVSAYIAVPDGGGKRSS